MTLREIQILGILFLCILFAIASCSPPAEASGSTSAKGYVNDQPLRLKSRTTRSGATTKGWVGSKHVRLKSTTRGKTTTTKGYVNGKYVRIKTKKR